MDTMLKPMGIIAHHSKWQDRKGLNFPNVEADQIARGWEDCAYHYFLEMVGGDAMIVTGRPLQFEGGHTLGHNNTIGICIHGDYDETVPPVELIDCFVRVVLGLWTMYPHLVGNLHYHSEYADKSCPGSKFPARKSLLGEVRRLKHMSMMGAH